MNELDLTPSFMGKWAPKKNTDLQRWFFLFGAILTFHYLILPWFMEIFV